MIVKEPKHLTLVTPEGAAGVAGLSDSVSFDRLYKKDELVQFEADMIAKYDYVGWMLNTPLDDHPDPYSVLFVKKHDREYLLRQFLSLPLLDDENQLEIVKDVWLLQSRGPRSNYPNGYALADIMFVGEAPGWNSNTSLFNVPIYSFGRTSLLFRYLARVVFGEKIWITNIFKEAIQGNTKPSGKTLDDALITFRHEYDIIQPVVIVCLGGYVYDALKDDYPNVHKIYHPAYIYKQGNNMTTYLRNMTTVRKEIYG